MWRNINELLTKKNYRNDSISLKVNEVTTSDPAIIAEEFNRYFSSIPGKLISSEIPPTNICTLFSVPTVANTFVCFPTDTNEVGTIIAGIPNKGRSFKTIPNFIYKRISRLITPFLSKVINISFSTGIFREFLKIGRVIPLFKVGDKLCEENYRHITTLHFISKIFEKCMHFRLLSFLREIHIFIW